jgi:hypothetical protein
MRRLLLLASVLSWLTGTYAAPRPRHDHLIGGKQLLQGLEVNGLFNPMKRFFHTCQRLILSVNPQLFERASEEHGNTLTSYHDICTSPSTIHANKQANFFHRTSSIH